MYLGFWNLYGEDAMPGYDPPPGGQGRERTGELMVRALSSDSCESTCFSSAMNDSKLARAVLHGISSGPA